MRTVCIFTKEHEQSVQISKRCVESARAFGIGVELYQGVHYSDMDLVHAKYNLVAKYSPVSGSRSNFKKRQMPRTRVANGTSHYLLYRWAVENDTPVHILEHDSYFIDQPPEPIYDGIIQTSSHHDYQMTPARLWSSMRAQKQRKHEPRRKYNNKWTSGVIRHPLSGTNGTSGYIVGPGAARRMVDYIECDGIANADRIRCEHAGAIYLQVPQSVFCDHAVKSCSL